jgi:hypothetical protein
LVLAATLVSVFPQLSSVMSEWEENLISLQFEHWVSEEIQNASHSGKKKDKLPLFVLNTSVSSKLFFQEELRQKETRGFLVDSNWKHSSHIRLKQR